jgi:hypothetical protein
MVETTYRIAQRDDGSFVVEVIRFGALPQTAAGFATEAAVQGWIAQDKRLWQSADPSQTNASRKWRDG